MIHDIVQQAITHISVWFYDSVCYSILSTYPYALYTVHVQVKSEGFFL